MQIYSNAWTVGAPGLHKPLQKLAGTWSGVFPSHVLKAVNSSIIYSSTKPLPSDMSAGSGLNRKPMMKDPRLEPGSVGAVAGPIMSNLLGALASGPLDQFNNVDKTKNVSSLRTGEAGMQLELRTELIKVHMCLYVCHFGGNGLLEVNPNEMLTCALVYMIHKIRTIFCSNSILSHNDVNDMHS